MYSRIRVAAVIAAFASGRTSLKFSITLAAVVVPLAILVFQPKSRATSNIITVNTLSDSSTSGDGLCSLREAINNANAASDTSGGDCAPGTGTDTIKFSVSGTITLGTNGTLPTIANSSPGSLTIDGSGQAVTIDGASLYGVLAMDSNATLNVNLLTIAHGNEQELGAAFGGGIDNAGGTLTVTDSTFSSNTAGTAGGGIYNELGTLTVTGSTFSSNSAGGSGGGIDNAGTLTVSNSTFSNNTASGNEGGGIDSGGPATITNVTFFSNSAFVGGGVAQIGSGTLTVTNSTFSSNTASGNEGGGGVFNAGNGGTLTITNSILANGTSNCSGGVTSGGYNISDDGSCGFGSSTGVNGKTIGDNVSDGNLNLASGLANNGGPTQTIALEPGSYAMDAVPMAQKCPATDQRGFPRPGPDDTGATHLACDAGAFETGETPSPSVIGYIEACYFCTNAWTFNGAALSLLDGPAFMIENVTGNPITNVSFAANGDSFSVGTVPANGSVVLVPGVSNDGGSGHSFWNFTNSILDTSDVGPDADTTAFDLSGTWNAESATTGLFTAGQSKSPSNDTTVASINFLGGPGNTDAPCIDCYGPEVVATISLPSEGSEQLVVNPSPPSKLNFGSVSVGTTSASQSATITSEFNDDTVDFFGTFVMGNFVKTGSTCGSSLAPLQSCQVSFACKPKTTGALIGAYAFLYRSVESGIMDADDYLKIGVVQFTCTGS